MFKSAFITILGLPNAGKSTFLNAALGEDLVITNPKAQTTRHRIKGILNEKGYQLIFSDTPGIIEESAYRLQEAMMGAVQESLEDADVVLLILDGQYPKIETFEAYKNQVNCPIVAVMNKADLVKDQDQLQADITKVKEYLGTEHVYAASAKEGFNIDGVIKTLVELAPEHPPFYDTETISDENVRFLVSEMIRSLGIASRKRIEDFIKKKIFLSLTVKVKKDWRSDEQQLKRFGYLKK